MDSKSAKARKKERLLLELRAQTELRPEGVSLNGNGDELRKPAVELSIVRHKSLHASRADTHRSVVVCDAKEHV